MNTIRKIEREGNTPRVVRWHEHLREHDAFALEVAYIALFGRRNNGTGILTNLTDGGEGTSGRIVGEDTKKKMADAQRGKPVSDEARIKIGNASRGKIIEDWHRLRISEANTGRLPSDETRQKLKGAWQDDAVRKKRIAGIIASFDENRKTELSEKMKTEWRVPANRAARSKKIREALKQPEEKERRSAATASSWQEPAARARHLRARRMLPPRIGYRGAYKSKNKWFARISIDGEISHLGTFSTPEAAARAYDKAAFEAWGRDCYLNFPDELDGGASTA